jgi:Protein of unknown function (DUF3429)
MVHDTRVCRCHNFVVGKSPDWLRRSCRFASLAIPLLNIVQILSFLGAIHWGLEFSRYGNTSSRRRYLLGLGASLVAWPTVLFPYEYALGAQFLGFTGMYFADASLASQGLAPPWYGTYRFILTLVVGVAIVISFIGRGEVEVARSGSHRNLAETGQQDGRERIKRYESEKAKAWDQKKKEDEERKKREQEEEAKKHEEELKKNLEKNGKTKTEEDE